LSSSVTTMPDKLNALFRELERFGNENDAQASSRLNKMRNVTPETGEFLRLLVRATKARRILEIGTSNGYSTLWLACAVQPMNGSVTTLEKSPFKADMARANFARAEMQPWINLHLIDAGAFIRQQAAAAFDFIFLDSERYEYPAWWPDLQRVLAPGGLLVVDNAVSHAHELGDFVQAVQKTPGYITSLVPVGKGEWVILKEAIGTDDISVRK
jgi:predicted O-methyltransferase YrrM